ncbi:MAG: hypothetical protein PUD92_02630 [Clostridiales bacterium]|nr:hypothetical protein [Clostridiales bacterium]
MKFYFGIVYKNSSTMLELITEQTDGVSDINNAEQFSTVGAYKYLYDYDKKQKYRVSLGGINQSSNMFNFCYADAGRNYVSWNAVIAEDVYPMLALVKTVDGDVTDVVYYAAS